MPIAISTKKPTNIGSPSSARSSSSIGPNPTMATSTAGPAGSRRLFSNKPDGDDDRHDNHNDGPRGTRQDNQLPHSESGHDQFPCRCALCARQRSSLPLPLLLLGANPRLPAVQPHHAEDQQHEIGNPEQEVVRLWQQNQTGHKGQHEDPRANRRPDHESPLALAPRVADGAPRSKGAPQDANDRAED